MEKKKIYLKLATPESSGRLSTSVQRFELWGRLGN